MFRFIHIGFAFSGVPKMRDLEPIIGQFGDWIRYSVSSWIVWTDRPVPEIYARLKPHLDVNDQVLIVKLDMTEGFGWMSPWVWNWINSKMPSTIFTGPPVENALLGYFPPSPPPPWGRK